MRIGISMSIAVSFEKRVSKATLATAMDPGTNKMIKSTFTQAGSPSKHFLKLFIEMLALPSNDPSSVTRPAGRTDCKPWRHAGFAAAHC